MKINDSISISPPGCDAKQEFREEPRYTEVNPGANAELRCVIENIGGECRWQKDGKVSSALFTLLLKRGAT